MGQDSDQGIWVISLVSGKNGYSVQNFSKKKFDLPKTYLSVEENLQFINTNNNVKLTAKPTSWRIEKTRDGPYTFDSLYKAENGGDYFHLYGAKLSRDVDKTLTVMRVV
jgi:hypothetical protein